MTHPNKTLLEALERIDAALEQTSLLNGVPYHPVKTVDEIRLDVPNVVGQINAFILLLNAYPAIRTALTAAGESEGELREALEPLLTFESKCDNMLDDRRGAGKTVFVEDIMNEQLAVLDLREPYDIVRYFADHARAALNKEGE